MRPSTPAATGPASTSGRPVPRPFRADWRRARSDVRHVVAAFFKTVAKRGSVDDAAWEGKYGEQALRHGLSKQQGPREQMEDFSHLVEKARCGFLFASVYDGHGGKAAGQYLQKELYGVFSDAIDNDTVGALECSTEDVDESGLCCPLELRPVLTEAFKRTDAELQRWLKRNAEGEELHSGCTATMALVRSDKLIVANVGDSRAVLSRGGTALDLTVEHRVYGKGPVVAAETQRIEAGGGWVDDGRVCGILAVSRAFGDMDFKGAGLAAMLRAGVKDGFWDKKFASSRRFTADPVIVEPDVTELRLREGDEFLVVATDGLWDVVSSQDAVRQARAELRAGRHPQAVAEMLTQLALKRRTADNVAVVVVDLVGGAAAWAATPAAAAPTGLKKLFGSLFG